MIAGPWPTRAAFEAWWLANIRAFNRLAVTDRPEWERVTAIIEKYQRESRP